MKIRSTIRDKMPRPQKGPPAVTAPCPPPEPEADPVPDFGRELELSYRVYQPLSRLATDFESGACQHPLPLSRWWLFGAQAICLIQDRTAYIAFRGSESWLDWYVDLLALPVPRTMRHLGFTLGWLRCRSKILDWLSHHRDAFDAVVLTGHSLGGALALLAARRIAEAYPVSRVVTFGAPKVYWLSADSYDQTPVAGSQCPLSAVTYRVIHHADVITDLPPFFAEAGRLIYLDPRGEVLQDSRAEERREEHRRQRWIAVNRSLDPTPTLPPDSGGSLRYWATVFFQAFKHLLLPAVYFWLYFRLLFHMSGRGADHLLKKYASAVSIILPSEPTPGDWTTWQRVVSAGNMILFLLLVVAPAFGLVSWTTYWLFLRMVLPWLERLSGGL